MRQKTKKVLISLPVAMLRKIDRAAKKARQDRSAFIYTVMEMKFFGDEMEKANK